MRVWGVIAAMFALGGCQPPRSTADDDAGTDGTTSSSSTDAGASTTSSSTTSPSTTTTTTGDPESSSGDRVDVPGGWLVDPDSGELGCSVFDQNCPPGEKCMPYANDGGNSWNDLRCTPIDPDPDQVGESCTVVGSGVSGVDSCDLGSMCYYVDPETNTGTCVALCIGSENHPDCEYPGQVCTISAEGVTPLCIPLCNPLEMDCPDGQGCYMIDGELFVCAPDASGAAGAYGDGCEFRNACDAGLFCADAAAVPGCEGGVSCCSAYCNIDAPSCPDAAQDCLPAFEPGQAPFGYEQVGLCVAQ